MYLATSYIVNDESTWVNGKLKIFDIVIVFYCSLAGTTTLAPCIASFHKMKIGTFNAKKIAGIINLPKTLDVGVQLQNDIKSIEFENVSFSYPTKPSIEILKNLSFKIISEQKIGIVGPTGSGKSTIAQLLIRLYSYNSGKILLDNMVIDDYDLKSLRNNISYVSQEPLLFSTSIKKNVKQGEINYSDEEIISALKDAEAYEFVEDLPEKIETYVGNNGYSLSGGQKQRIALARTFIRNSQIIILDEATSALDYLTEMKILHRIYSKFKPKTVIFIAQRLNTVKNCDNILLIQEGKVVESGKFDELMDRKGLFYNFSSVSQPNEDESMIEDAVVSLTENSEEKDDFIQKTTKNFEKKYMSLKKLFLKYPLILCFIFISASIAGCTFPIFGYLVSKMYTNLFQTSNTSEMTSLYYMVCLIIDGGIYFIAMTILCFVISKISLKISDELRKKSFLNIVYFDPIYFENKENHPAMISKTLRENIQNLSTYGGSVLSV